MDYWRIQSPDYDSDYRHTYINGKLAHPFGLPGIHCEVCGQTWGGCRVLPVECPPSLRKHPNLKRCWPIHSEQHEALQAELTHAIKAAGVKPPIWLPGDSLQPSFLDVPSRPTADFLWCNLGSVVVSRRVKRLFESRKTSGVSLCPVTLRKIGKRPAILPPPIPSTGEPEDIINEVRELSDPNSVGPYFELIVENVSGYPTGQEPVSVCKGCGRESQREGRGRFRMEPTMWQGADIFHLAGTLYLMVTQPLKEALQKLHPTNLRFVKVRTD